MPEPDRTFGTVTEWRSNSPTFAALDPSYAGAGMNRVSHGDEETWDEYAGDTDLQARPAGSEATDPGMCMSLFETGTNRLCRWSGS